jgi:hypothetical protein
MRSVCVLAGALALANLTAACSTRPLPEDFSGYTTYEIVKKIRCESQAAMRDHALIQMEKLGEDPAILSELKAHPGSFATFDRKRLKPKVDTFIETYDEATIGYDFTFDMSEVNNASTDGGFLHFTDRGPFRLGYTAGNDRRRQNIRTFRIIDGFEGVTRELPYKDCKAMATGEKGLYPITGEIGLKEMIATFYMLHQDSHLIGKTDPNVPVLTDTLEFTTKLYTSANPRIELSPIGTDFQLVSAGLKTDVSRSDIHKVTIALTLPVEVRPPPQSDGAQSDGAPRVHAAPRPAFDAATVLSNELDRQEQITTNTEIMRRLDTLPLN